MKTLVVVLSLVLVSSAGASSRTHGHSEASLSLRVCEERVAVSTPPVGANSVVVPRVYVNGNELPGTMVGTTVEWAGRGVIARLRKPPGRVPIRFRVASLRDDCARVRLVIRFS